MRRTSSAWLASVALLTGVILSTAAPSPAQGPRSQRVITSQTDAVYAVKFSPDNRLLAIARMVGNYGRVELWDTETGALRKVIKGFDGSVWSLSFAPDGKTLVTSSSRIRSSKLQEARSREGRRFVELKWWDTQSGELKQERELPGEDRISMAALHSPNGKTLVTIEYHSGVLLNLYRSLGPWDRDVPDIGNPRRMSSMAFDSDLKLLDAGTGDVIIKLKGSISSYEMPMGGPAGTDFASLYLLNQRRQPLAISPDGRFIASWNSGEIKLWDSGTGDGVRKLKDFKGSLSAVTFSPDGHSLAAAITRFSYKHDVPVFQSEVRLYDPNSGALLQTVPVKTRSISGVVFANNGLQLLISGLQRQDEHLLPTLELASLQTGSAGKLVSGDEGTVSSVALSPNGQMLAFQSDASTVKLLDTHTWRTLETFDGTGDVDSNDLASRRFVLSVKTVLALAFSPDGKMVLGEVEQSGIKLWDTRTGELRKQLADQDETNSLVGISANGNMAAEVAADETLRLWNLISGQKETLAQPGHSASTIALSADGQTVAVANERGIALISSATHEVIRTFDGPPKIKCASFSSDARSLATTGDDGRITIWDLQTGKLRHTMNSAGKVTALRFAPGGQRLASATEDGAVSFWNVETGALEMQLKKHSAAVNAITFSADGQLMATGGDDRTVIIWDALTGKSRHSLKGHDLTVTSLAFSPDGSLLASGSGNASVVLWDVPTGKLNRVLR